MATHGISIACIGVTNAWRAPFPLMFMQVFIKAHKWKEALLWYGRFCTDTSAPVPCWANPHLQVISKNDATPFVTFSVRKSFEGAIDLHRGVHITLHSSALLLVV